ncbi:hypothetical protein LINPERHAP2_LOCUS126 [Linum perenne]
MSTLVGVLARTTKATGEWLRSVISRETERLGFSISADHRYFSGELLAVLIKERILFNTYSSSISEPSVRAVIEELQLSRMGDELIDIVIRHGGRMDFSGSEPKYVGGEENVVGLDTDYLSYRTLLACAKEDLGY